MESLSFESTIESPTKPHQEIVPDKNNKSLFLVQVISDSKNTDQSSQNLENNNNEENKEIKEIKERASHILNFDKVLSIVFPEEKIKKSEKKKVDKKLLGNKKKRQIKPNNNKSKDVNGKEREKDNDFINNNKNNRRTNEDIYNINNFCSSTVKIREKSLYQNVVVPNFEELDDDFFEDNCIEVRILL